MHTSASHSHNEQARLHGFTYRLDCRTAAGERSLLVFLRDSPVGFRLCDDATGRELACAATREGAEAAARARLAQDESFTLVF